MAMVQVVKLLLLLCLLIPVVMVLYSRHWNFTFAFVHSQQNPSSSTGTQSDLVQVSTVPKEQREGVDKCPETPPLLVGPLRVEFNMAVSLELVKANNVNLEPGGRYKPKYCQARQKVAIIIPFRNRYEHLKLWLYYLHPILQRQQLDYGVYVINQAGDELFNRAKLLNVGYTEALKDEDYKCFVFSDVDLIPMDDRNMYHCFPQPRHLAAYIDKFGFRLASKGISITRPSVAVGKYKMIRHRRDKHNESNPRRLEQLSHTQDTMDKDGINSLSYKLLSRQTLDLFTQITVDIGKP